MNLLNFQVLIIVGIMDISTSTHSISNPCTKIQKIIQVLSELTGFSNCRGCIHNSVGFLEAQQLSRVFLNTFLKFPNFLTETKVFSFSVPRKKPLLGPFYLFLELVPARGIIGIGLFQRKSWKITGNGSDFLGKI